jgi:hypothetical protein
MTGLLLGAALKDRGASWGGPVVGMVAAAVFVAFAVWIVVQRVRHGRPTDGQEPGDE